MDVAWAKVILRYPWNIDHAILFKKVKVSTLSFN
jgi:hypothetical protein